MNQIYNTKSAQGTKSTITNLLKHLYKNKFTKPNLPNLAYQTKNSEPNLTNIKSTQLNLLKKNQTMITEPNQQIKISQT